MNGPIIRGHKLATWAPHWPVYICFSCPARVVFFFFNLNALRGASILLQVEGTSGNEREKAETKAQRQKQGLHYCRTKECGLGCELCFHVEGGVGREESCDGCSEAISWRASGGSRDAGWWRVGGRSFFLTSPFKTKACKPPSHHPSPAYSPNQESHMANSFPDP